MMPKHSNTLTAQPTWRKENPWSMMPKHSNTQTHLSYPVARTSSKSDEKILRDTIYLKENETHHSQNHIHINPLPKRRRDNPWSMLPKYPTASLNLDEYPALTPSESSKRESHFTINNNME